LSEPVDYLVGEGEIELNAGRPTIRLLVSNTGDRPIQVGSHYHFFEVNRALRFDRRAAYGHRLDIPAGLAVRFEPGDERDVDLVPFGGAGQVIGFAALVDGALTDQAAALERAARYGLLEQTEPAS
jgi:urease beta subunit